MDNEKPSTNKELPDAFALFKPSWKAFQLNFETFVWQILLPTAIAGLIILSFVIGTIVYGSSDESNFLPFILPCLLAIIGFGFIIAITASLVITELHSARGQHISFREAMHEVRGRILRLFGLFILVSLAVGIGMILFIVPGIFALQRLLMAPYYLVDQKVGIWESMRLSWRDGKSKQFSGAIWGVVGVIIVINLISWIPLLGWLASLVLTVIYLCAPAIRYIQIMQRKKSSTPIEA